MNNFSFYVPTRYVFGENAKLQTGKTIANLGYKNVLVVYGLGSVVRSGLLDSVKSQLDELNIKHCELGGVKPNPRADLVYEGIKLGRKEKVDLVLPVGGGSAIDCAKAIAMGIVDDSNEFFDFYDGKRIPNKAVDVGVVLTIPAAGSESSTGSVINKELNGVMVKYACNSELIIPKFAIMDPTLTFTVNAYQTACGVTDMIAHICERYFTNTPDVTVTDNFCEGLIRSIVKHAPVILKEPTNYQSRANVMWAGAMAHNNLCGVDREQDWASHDIEHQLSALYDIAHGAGLAVIMPSWMDYVYKHDVNRFAQWAHEVFSIDVSDDKESMAKAGIKAFRSFLHAIGMPTNFKDIGAKVEDIPHMLDTLGLTDDSKSVGGFVKLHRKDVEQIYLIASKASV